MKVKNTGYLAWEGGNIISAQASSLINFGVFNITGGGYEWEIGNIFFQYFFYFSNRPGLFG